MSCVNGGPVLARVTRGLVAGAEDRTLSIVSQGLLGGTLEEGLSASVAVVSPLDAAIDVERTVRFVVQVSDPDNEIEASQVTVRYRQTPFPAASADGWVTCWAGGPVTGFSGTRTGSVSKEVGVDGEVLVVTIQPQFGLLPGGVHTVEVTYEDCFGNTFTASSTFTTLDNAVSVSLRSELYKLTRYAARYGWEDLLAATPTYTYEADTAYTGGRLNLSVNESLAADLGDQLGESAFGLAILNNVRRYAVMAKLGGYARSKDDPDATVVAQGYIVGVDTPVFTDRKVPGEQQSTDYVDANRTAGVTRYYSLLLLTPPTEEVADWRWSYSEAGTFTSAFAFGRYGHGAKLFAMLPAAWQKLDGELS